MRVLMITRLAAGCRFIPSTAALPLPNWLDDLALAPADERPALPERLAARNIWLTNFRACRLFVDPRRALPVRIRNLSSASITIQSSNAWKSPMALEALKSLDYSSLPPHPLEKRGSRGPAKPTITEGPTALLLSCPLKNLMRRIEKPTLFLASVSCWICGLMVSPRDADASRICSA